MKTILIPTNFTNDSIEVAETIVADANENVNLVFTHLFHVADDIQDLLFSGSREREHELVSTDFKEACNVLKENAQGKINTIKIDFFYGNKLASLKNFLEYHEVDFIAYSESKGVPKLNKNSLDALPVLKKCGITLVNTDLISIDSFSEASSVHG